ncbi:hypothetical protein QOT17_002172 [Balamuthia mandrillaris]
MFELDTPLTSFLPNDVDKENLPSTTRRVGSGKTGAMLPLKGGSTSHRPPRGAAASKAFVSGTDSTLTTPKKRQALGNLTNQEEGRATPNNNTRLKPANKQPQPLSVNRPTPNKTKGLQSLPRKTLKGASNKQPNAHASKRVSSKLSVLQVAEQVEDVEQSWPEYHSRSYLPTVEKDCVDLPKDWNVHAMSPFIGLYPTPKALSVTLDQEDDFSSFLADSCSYDTRPSLHKKKDEDDSEDDEKDEMDRLRACFETSAVDATSEEVDVIDFGVEDLIEEIQLLAN